MRRIVGGICAAAIILTFAAVRPSPAAETLRAWSGFVPATSDAAGSCTLVLTAPLRAGDYVVRVSGTFAPDPYVGRGVDARWSTESFWENHANNPGAGLALNGGRPEWGAYSPSHEYALPVVHAGGPMAFRILDTDNCGDNPAGGLSVDVQLADADGDGASNSEESALCGRAAIANAINTAGAAGECASAGDFEASLDADGDGAGDLADNCPGTENADQADADDDGTGDACEPPELPNGDQDGDTVPDAAEPTLCQAEDQTTSADGSCAGDDYTPAG